MRPVAGNGDGFFDAPEMGNKPVEKLNRSEFDRLLELLRQRLLDAKTHFDIWEALQNPSKEFADAVNLYRGFFVPTIGAHITSFFVRLAGTIDRDRRAASFYRVIEIVARNPSLAPGLNVAAFRANLESREEVFERIRTVRHRRAAHWDTDDEPDDVTVQESRQVLTDLASIFNGIYKCVKPGETWMFEYVQASDTNGVLDALTRLYATRATLGLLVWGPVRSPVTVEVDRDLLEELRKYY